MVHCVFATLQIEKNTNRRRVETTAKVQSALSAGTVDGEVKVWVQLPRQDDHTNHVVGEVQ